VGIVGRRRSFVGLACAATSPRFAISLADQIVRYEMSIDARAYAITRLADILGRGNLAVLTPGIGFLQAWREHGLLLRLDVAGGRLGDAGRIFKQEGLGEAARDFCCGSNPVHVRITGGGQGRRAVVAGDSLARARGGGHWLPLKSRSGNAALRKHGEAFSSPTHDARASRGRWRGGGRGWGVASGKPSLVEGNNTRGRKEPPTRTPPPRFSREGRGGKGAHGQKR